MTIFALEDGAVNDLQDYLISVCGDDEYVDYSPFISALLTAAINETDLKDLRGRYKRGYVDRSTATLAELYDDVRVAKQLWELADAARRSLKGQLPPAIINKMSTSNGIIIVKVEMNNHAKFGS